ncbi:MAG: hypothetical protein R6X23_08850, partial [Acidimicrobiia bacterium]
MSPVRARYATPEQAFADALDAGETALANQSMLAPPPVRSVAVSSAAWASYVARHAAPMHEPGLDDPGSVVVEVWTYPPE